MRGRGGRRDLYLDTMNLVAISETGGQPRGGFAGFMKRDVCGLQGWLESYQQIASLPEIEPTQIICSRERTATTRRLAYSTSL